MPASARSDSFTAAALGNAFATSGSSSTTFVPCAKRRAYLPRTPPAKSQFSCIAGTAVLPVAFFTSEHAFISHRHPHRRVAQRAFAVAGADGADLEPVGVAGEQIGRGEAAAAGRADLHHGRGVEGAFAHEDEVEQRLGVLGVPMEVEGVQHVADARAEGEHLRGGRGGTGDAGVVGGDGGGGHGNLVALGVAFDFQAQDLEFRVPNPIVRGLLAGLRSREGLGGGEGAGGGAERAVGGGEAGEFRGDVAKGGVAGAGGHDFRAAGDLVRDFIRLQVAL